MEYNPVYSNVSEEHAVFSFSVIPGEKLRRWRRYIPPK
jgi:hypothetical protein